MGWNDELEAYLRTLGQKSGSYKTERDRIRALQDKYAEAHPYMSGGLEMAGSVVPFFVPGIGPVLTGSRGAAMAARAGLGAKGRLAMGALSSGAANAATGAVTGAGEALEREDVPLDASVGALTNAILGPVQGGVVLAGQKGLKAARKAKAFSGKKAERELYDLLNRYAGV
jgi:hypothetical protein